MSPSLVITVIVRQKATKTKMAWKMCATTLHFWIYDCGIRILAFSSPYMLYIEPGVCVVEVRKAERVSVNTAQPCDVDTEIRASLRCYRVSSSAQLE
jgi:hypothetical protein